jgi:iron complex outermembrane receptor protein
MNKSISFKKKLLATLVASTALTGFSGAASAQSNETADEIVVTGIKASLERSIDIKRNSDQIVEAITADDIGKFPDQNVAESLQRVPGVQIDRQGGEGTKVRIRGLGDNVTLLNGSTFVTGLEYYQAGEGRTEFGGSLEGVPSELLGGVDIAKTPRASDIEGALGGIVNLKTRSPLALKAPLAVVSLKADSGQYSQNMKPSGTITVGDVWDNFGAILSLTKDMKVVHNDEAQNLNRNGFAWHEDSKGASYVVPGMTYLSDKEDTRDRLGASVNLAWAPTESSEVTLDWFHSKLKVDDRSYSVKFTENVDGGALDEAHGAHTIDSHGVVTSGAFTTSGENNGSREITDITTDNLKLGFKTDLDKWHFDGAASFARADLTKDAAYSDSRYAPYSVPQLDATSSTGWKNSAPNIVSGDTDARYFTTTQSSNGVPAFVLSPAAAAAIKNSANNMYKSSWAFGDRSKNDSNSFVANAKYDLDFGDVKAIKFGYRHADDEVNFVEGHYQVDLSTKINAQGVATSVPNGHSLGDVDGDGKSDNQLWGASTRYVDAAISNPAFGSLTSTGKDLGKVLYGVNAGRWDGNAPGIIPWHTYDQMPDYYTRVKDFFPSSNTGPAEALFTDPAKMGKVSKWLSTIASGEKVSFIKDKVQSWDVDTKTDAVYFETEIKGDAVPYSINAGVRIIKTEVSTKGGKTTPNDVWYGTDSWNGPVDVKGSSSALKSYTDVLPSVNFSLNTSDDQKVRFSLARVMARPNDQDLGHGANFNFTRNNARGGYEFVNGSVGNPMLDPTRAAQADLNYEWYFGDVGYLSFGTFLKSIDTFQVDRAVQVVVADTTTIDLPGQKAGSTLGQINTPENGTGGSVKGLELAFQQGFDNGLGYSVNYTYSDSTTNLTSETHKHLSLPGVSQNSFNFIGFYEANGLHARVSYTWRDKYLSPDLTLETIAASSGHATSTFASFYDAYGQVDVSLSYDVSDKLSVSFDALNLAGAEQRRFIEYENFFRSNNAPETRYVFGAKYQF